MEQTLFLIRTQASYKRGKWYSQREFAQMLGVDKMTYNKLERASLGELKHSATRKTKQKIADSLMLPLHSIKWN